MQMPKGEQMAKKQILEILEASRDASLYITEQGFFINDKDVTKQMDKFAKLKFNDFKSCSLPYIWSAYVQGFQLYQGAYLNSVPNYKALGQCW